MQPLAQAPDGAPIDVERVAPAIEALLPRVTQVLGRDGRCAPGSVQVLATHARSWSSVWELGCGEDRYILKWLPRRAARELELTEQICRVFGGDASVRTPRIACNPTPDTFLVEKLPGRPLHELCTQPPVFGVAGWISARCRLLERIGGWLGRFHAAGREPGAAPLTGVKAYVQNREQALAALERPLVEELWRRLDRAVSAAPVRVHGDFTPHNVLVADATISVIDLAGINELERDTPAFDVAAMVVGLQETWRRRGRNHMKFFAAPVNRLTASFVGASGLDERDETLPLCYAVRHLQRIHGIMRATGRVPGAKSWHVRQVRLALEHPDRLPWGGMRA